MNNDDSKSQNYLWIKKLTNDFKEEDYEFLKYKETKFHFIKIKKSLYIEYENYDNMEYVFNNKKNLIYENLGKEIELHKVIKLPLDLNPASKIILLIFNIKGKFKINESYILELIKIKPIKWTIFSKNHSQQSLIQYDDIDIAIKVKDSIPHNFDNKIFIKTYYTKKQDLNINQKNKNEFDYSIKSSILSKQEIFSSGSSNNFKKDIFVEQRSNKTNTKTKRYNEGYKYENLLIESNERINTSEIFNIFSIYGIINFIKLSNNKKRAVVIYENSNNYEKAHYNYNLLPNNSINFNIIIPTININNIENDFLNLKDINDIYDKFKRKDRNRNKTLKLSNFQTNIDCGKVDNKKIQSISCLDNTISIFKYSKIDQRKIAIKYSDKIHEPSRFLIIGNFVNNNNNNIKKFELFLKKSLFQEKQIISLFQQIKGTKKFILICPYIITAVKILSKFHNVEFEDKKLNILFASSNIKNMYIKTYNIKEEDYKPKEVQQKINEVYFSEINTTDKKNRKKKKYSKLNSDFGIKKNNSNNSKQNNN